MLQLRLILILKLISSVARDFDPSKLLNYLADARNALQCWLLLVIAPLVLEMPSERNKP